MINYKEVVVPKPWGSEYLLFEENNVAGWILNIRKGEKTSLHCHPKKKTSLIVLEGIAKISFLTSHAQYGQGSKVIIRQGVFHSTEAVTDLIVLEIETPIDKGDLVRLQDNYGRENKQYETEVQARTPTEFYIFREDVIQISSYTLAIVPISKYSIFKLVVILEGGFFKNDIIIAGPGDCLTREVFNLFLNEFELKSNTLGLEIL